MVDLPEASRALTVSEQPRTAVTPGAIRAPYDELAHSLDRLAGASESIGTDLNNTAEIAAAQAGQQAVTRGPDGQVEVAPHPLIIGRAALVYARAVKVGATAAAEQDAMMNDAQLRQDFGDDPQGYLKAARDYRDKQVAFYSGSAGPETGGAVGRLIDNQIGQTYGNLVNSKYKRDLSVADGNMQLGIKQATNDLRNMARQGITSGQPWDDAMSKLRTLTDERVSAPNSTYSRDQADYDLGLIHDEVAGQGFLYHVDQIYKNDKVDAPTRAKQALDYAQGVLTDPSINLSPEQREKLYHQAAGEIRANEALRRQDVTEARQAYAELRTASALGEKIEPQDVETLVTAAQNAGDYALAASVRATFARKPLNDQFGLQPASERARQINELLGAPRQKAAYDFFISKGWSPVQAAGIVGGLRGETENLNNFQIHDAGMGFGIAGWNGERLAGLQRFAKSNNMDFRDLNTQLEYLNYELRNTEKLSGDRLSAAGTPEEAGQAMLGFFRPKDFDVAGAHPERAIYARAAYAAFGGGGPLPSQAVNPATSSWLLVNRERASDKASWDEWNTIMDAYNKEGVRPSPQQVNGITDAANATGNSALLEQIRHDYSRIQFAADVADLPTSQRHEVIAGMERQAASPGGLDPGHAALLKDLQHRDQAISEGLKDNPIATTAKNFPDRFTVPPALNIGDQAQFRAGLSARADIAGFASQNWAERTVPALDKADVAQIQGTLENADPATQSRILGDIVASLPENVRNATLAKIGEKNEKMMATVAAGGLQSEAPDVAASILRGQAAVKVDKRNDPLEGPNKQTFEDALDKALPQGVFSQAALTNPTGPYAMMRGAVAGRVADLLSTSAKKDVTPALVQQAVTDVTGGVLDAHGSPIIAPKRGMSQREYDATIFGLTDADFPDVTTPSGVPITADYVRHSAQLQSLDDGRYLIKIGNGYAYQGANELRAEAFRPFVLDLRNRQASTKYVPPPDAVNVAISP